MGIREPRHGGETVVARRGKEDEEQEEVEK